MSDIVEQLLEARATYEIKEIPFDDLFADAAKEIDRLRVLLAAMTEDRNGWKQIVDDLYGPGMTPDQPAATAFPEFERGGAEAIIFDGTAEVIVMPSDPQAVSPRPLQTDEGHKRG